MLRSCEEQSSARGAAASAASREQDIPLLVSSSKADRISEGMTRARLELPGHSCQIQVRRRGNRTWDDRGLVSKTPSATPRGNRTPPDKGFPNPLPFHLPPHRDELHEVPTDERAGEQNRRNRRLEGAIVPPWSSPHTARRSAQTPAPTGPETTSARRVPVGRSSRREPSSPRKLVEAGGIEPPSRDDSTGASTGIVLCLVLVPSAPEDRILGDQLPVCFRAVGRAPAFRAIPYCGLRPGSPGEGEPAKGLLN
jgi:hypothetical protein